MTVERVARPAHVDPCSVNFAAQREEFPLRANADPLAEAFSGRFETDACLIVLCFQSDSLFAGHWTKADRVGCPSQRNGVEYSRLRAHYQRTRVLESAAREAESGCRAWPGGTWVPATPSWVPPGSCNPWRFARRRGDGMARIPAGGARRIRVTAAPDGTQQHSTLTEKRYQPHYSLSSKFFEPSNARKEEKASAKRIASRRSRLENTGRAGNRGRPD
jgi:hypothetical protein